MSDSVRPHRRQPTRLPRPWDCPGKNTGVGCHFLLQSLSCVRLLETSWTAAYQAPPPMGFSRQEYWSGLPLPSSRALQSEKLIPDLSRCSLRLVESLLFKKKAPQITDHSEHDNLSNLSESCSVVSYSFATSWTVACQAPLSMEFSRPEYWSVLPFLSVGESSQPKDQTWVSCIAGGFFTV